MMLFFFSFSKDAWLLIISMIFFFFLFFHPDIIPAFCYFPSEREGPSSAGVVWPMSSASSLPSEAAKKLRFAGSAVGSSPGASARDAPLFLASLGAGALSPSLSLSMTIILRHAAARAPEVHASGCLALAEAAKPGAEAAAVAAARAAAAAAAGAARGSPSTASFMAKATAASASCQPTRGRCAA
jgi:hypothetical protein